MEKRRVVACIGMLSLCFVLVVIGILSINSKEEKDTKVIENVSEEITEELGKPVKKEALLKYKKYGISKEFSFIYLYISQDNREFALVDKNGLECIEGAELQERLSIAEGKPIYINIDLNYLIFETEEGETIGVPFKEVFRNQEGLPQVKTRLLEKDAIQSNSLLKVKLVE